MVSFLTTSAPCVATQRIAETSGTRKTRGMDIIVGALVKVFLFAVVIGVPLLILKALQKPKQS